MNTTDPIQRLSFLERILSPQLQRLAAEQDAERAARREAIVTRYREAVDAIDKRRPTLERDYVAAAEALEQAQRAFDAARAHAYGIACELQAGDAERDRLSAIAAREVVDLGGAAIDAACAHLGVLWQAALTFGQRWGRQSAEIELRAGALSSFYAERPSSEVPLPVRLMDACRAAQAELASLRLAPMSPSAIEQRCAQVIAAVRESAPDVFDRAPAWSWEGLGALAAAQPEPPRRRGRA